MRVRTTLRAGVRALMLWVLAAWATLGLYNSFAPPVSLLMAAQVLSGDALRHRTVPLGRISPALSRAVLAAEDARFCEHHGVDWPALGDALYGLADEDGPASGASTITMQTTKNLFLWPGRSYLRKTLELPMSLLLDAIWSKRRILEVYLNVAEFGPGIYGAEAAAQIYFHRPARALSLSQASLLAAALPLPRRRNPARPSVYLQAYAERIAQRSAKVDAACVAPRRRSSYRFW